MQQHQQLPPHPASPAVRSGPVRPWNELLDATGIVRPQWAPTQARINSWTPEQRRILLEETGRMLNDLGTTFNVYSDVGGAGQPYEIDPIPFLLEFSEWDKIQKGLVQRMRLLETVLADLYGPRRLLAEGLLPPDLVHSCPDFHQSTRDIQPAGGKWLLVSGCDLVRGPNGTWKVLRDHTNRPGGLGQTLENRSVVSSVLPDLFEQCQVAKLKPFFDAEHDALQDITTSRGGATSIVFLTPGYRHPSYFEHAYKARLLGISLVEAADLTVRERRVFLKTLGGLRRVDVIISRLNDKEIDPLEYWTSGGGGVPGLIEAWRSGNVAIVNAPGSGFAGSPALQPFLPLICKKWFNEELLLPFVESWWLGQESVRNLVCSDLSPYILLSAFGTDELLPVKWSNLSAASKKQWSFEISRRPWDFVVQRDPNPSQVSSLQGRTIKARPTVLRSFLLNGTGDTYTVMPGGLARVGKPGVAPQLWSEHQGFTKDVWLVGNSPSPGPGIDLSRPLRRDRIGISRDVPSRIAEQLFWVGRYIERVDMVTRMLRVTLRFLQGEGGRDQPKQLAAALKLLAGSGVVVKNAEKMRSVAELSDLVFRKETKGSLILLIHGLMLNAASARDRLSDDTWIFINQLKGIIDRANRTPRATDLLHTLDKVVLHLAAFSGMQAENMIRGQGWRFLETGRRIERGLGILQLLKTASEDGAMLEPLVEMCDSVMTYRRRHFSKPTWNGVMNLLFFERFNPRSVGFQVEILKREATHYPGGHDEGLFPLISAKLEGLDAYLCEEENPDAAMLEKIGEDLESLSDLITQHYFSHSEKRVY